MADRGTNDEHAASRRGTDQSLTAAPARARQSLLGSVLVWVVVMAIPVALIGGGGWLLYQRGYGTRVRATVVECGLSGGISSGSANYRDDCTATWTIDGRVEVGPFTGGNGSSDVGKTVDATVRDGTAYSRSLVLPIVLLVLGLPFLALPISAVRSRRRAAGNRTARTAPDPGQ